MGQQLNRPGEESHTPAWAPVGSDIEYADEITMLKAMKAAGTCDAGQEIHLREF